MPDDQGRGGPGTLVTISVRLLIIALPAYFVWEMLQAPAFTGMPPGWWAATAVCTLAAAGDGVIVLAVFGIGAGLYRDWRWFAPPRPGRFAIVVLTGVIVHVAIEWVMVHLVWDAGATNRGIRSCRFSASVSCLSSSRSGSCRSCSGRWPAPNRVAGRQRHSRDGREPSRNGGRHGKRVRQLQGLGRAIG